ncbi:MULTISPECIES: hypothetical protein [unclassified Streptomyces]|uniref:hypothetical protein n=1 Tax=unclassified Streptomyces TaxID=2593676 RepID=UPI0033B6C039
MAKNKNQNRKQSGAPQSRASQAESPEQRSGESHETPAHVPGSPSDVARKKQKSFGHN